MRGAHYRYGEVLLLILASLVVQLAAPDGDWAHVVVVALQGATLVAAVVTSRAHRYLIRLTVVATALLVLGAITAVVGGDQIGNDSARVITLLLIALAPPVLVRGMIRQFREEGRITLQTMFAVLCLYLLIGLFFGTAFATIETIEDTRFFTATGESKTADFLYYSYSTLTTTGFGDLVTETDLGRALSIAEALIGQIYLVTVVALIVGNLRPAARITEGESSS